METKANDVEAKENRYRKTCYRFGKVREITWTLSKEKRGSITEDTTPQKK